MATAQQIRDLIEQTTSGTARLRVPREVRDEVCRYAVRSAVLQGEVRGWDDRSTGVGATFVQSSRNTARPGE